MKMYTGLIVSNLFLSIVKSKRVKEYNFTTFSYLKMYPFMYYQASALHFRKIQYNTV